MQRIHLHIAYLIVLLLAAVACTNPVHEWRGLIKIGFVAPFSGYDAGSAQRMLGAVKAAVDRRNQAGGVRGYRLELVALDDRNEPAAAAARAGELAIDPDVVAAVAHVGGDSDEVPVAYQRLQLPTFVIGGPEEGMDRSTGIWGLCASARAEGLRAARFAREEAGARRAAVVAMEGNGFVTAARSFAQALASQGQAPAVSVYLGPERWLSQERSASLAQELAQAGADFVYFSGRYEAGALLATAVAKVADARVLLGSDAATTALAPLLPADSSRLAFAASCLAPSVEKQTESSATGRSSGEAEEESRATLAANAAQYIIDVANEVAAARQPNRSSVFDALLRLGRDGSTVSPFLFDQTGRRGDAEVGVRWLVGRDESDR